MYESWYSLFIHVSQLSWEAQLSISAHSCCRWSKSIWPQNSSITRVEETQWMAGSGNVSTFWKGVLSYCMKGKIPRISGGSQSAFRGSILWTNAVMLGPPSFRGNDPSHPEAGCLCRCGNWMRHDFHCTLKSLPQTCTYHHHHHHHHHHWSNFITLPSESCHESKDEYKEHSKNMLVLPFFTML